MTHADRFRAVREHSQYPELMRQTPRSWTELEVIGGAAVLVLALVVLSKLGGGAFSSVGTLITLMLLGGGGFTLAKSYRVHAAPLQRSIGVVVDERMEVRGTRERTSTTYYVTLQFEQGQRREFAASADLAGRATRGDIGLAYTKLDRLIAFERVAD